MNRKKESVTFDSIVKYKNKRWIVYDWCPPCNSVYIFRYDKKEKRKKVKYEDIKLLLL